MAIHALSCPENIHRAIVFVQESGGSPVSVFESKIQNAINNGVVTPLSWHEKQFVGTATCIVMEKNGFRRTGRKQRFSKGIFKSGEIYAYQPDQALAADAKGRAVET